MSQQNITSLNLFASYTTRAAYRQATGQQAEQYRENVAVKTWIDPSPPSPDASGNVTYTYFDSLAASGDGMNGFKPFTVPFAECGRVNLLGAYVFPPPQPPAPTVAFETDPFIASGQIPIDPARLSTLADAQALAKAITPLFPGVKLTPGDPTAAMIGPFGINYGSETRRLYALYGTKAGASPVPIVVNVAQQIAISQANGVGAPGHWALSAGNLVWLQDEQVTSPPVGSPVPTTPMPVKPLPVGSTLQLIATLPGGTPDWVVVTGSAPGPIVSPTPVTSGAGNMQAFISMMKAMGMTEVQAQAQWASVFATLWGNA